MRIYSNPLEALKEVERDLFEMGLDIQVETMQDKDVRDNPDYLTKEVQGYAFKIVDWILDYEVIVDILEHLFKKGEAAHLFNYILLELQERMSGVSWNPGTSYKHRLDIWQEYLHNGKFAYTYSERLTPQLPVVIEELRKNPETRQAVLTIHSNIAPLANTVTSPDKANNNVVDKSEDLHNIGGGARVPCSMYYQLMIRKQKLDLIYTMRSCDFLTHFSVDLSLALMMQDKIAKYLKLSPGTFTMFIGSLHAYRKDMVPRGIF